MKVSKLSLKGGEKAGKNSAAKQPAVIDSSSTSDWLENLPPAYSEATRDGRRGASSSIRGPQPVLTRPTNYLTLIRESFPIRGTYRIDPTLPIPPGAILSKDQDGKELNLKFNSTNGSVEACIEIVRGLAPATGPARLEAVSINCDVTVTIHDPQPNRFRLSAISHSGNVVVNIPPTFIGSVVTKLNKGAVKFGAKVQSQLTVFSEQNNQGRYFIGDYLTTGYQNDESWTMDYLYVESRGGTVVVDFVSESAPVFPSRKPKPKPQKKSFLRRLLG